MRMTKFLAEVSFKYYNFANSILENKDIYFGVINLTNNYIFSKNEKVSYFNSKVNSKSSESFDIYIPQVKISEFLENNSKTVQIYSLKSEGSIIYKVRLDFLDDEYIFLDSIIINTDIKIYSVSPHSYINYIIDSLARSWFEEFKESNYMTDSDITFLEENNVYIPE